MKRIIFTTALLFVFIFLYIKHLEKTRYFYPEKKVNIYPDSLGLNFQDVFINTKDLVKLHGWFIPNAKAKFTVLFFHGNGGNISDRVEKIKVLYDLGFQIFIFDYRGYGKSSSTPSEQGLYKDARAACRYLMANKKIKLKNIIFYGESLGGAVAIDCALDYEPKAIIFEGTFSQAKDVAKEYYPFFPKALMTNKFDSLAKIVQFKCPQLYFHSKDDEVVPYHLGEKLFEAALGKKRFATLIGGHVDGFVDSEKVYKSEIKRFIKSLK